MIQGYFFSDVAQSCSNSAPLTRAGLGNHVADCVRFAGYTDIGTEFAPRKLSPLWDQQFVDFCLALLDDIVDFI